MLPVSQLNFGFVDAQNYSRRENRELFNRVFFRTEELDKLCGLSTYFLLGDKGTGKTAYAVYLVNNRYKENVATINHMRETEYLKFVSLKNDKHLVLSDYTAIWKVIIYLLMAESITEKEMSKSVFGNVSRFHNLRKAIKTFYKDAFSPEIITAISFIEDHKISAQMLSQFAGVGGEYATGLSFTESKFQTNLLYIQKQFEEALSTIKLAENHILFIDSIDVRPASVAYDEYLDCVKGLANAVWSVNNDFFAQIRDSKGRLRVVLLARPDIFNSLGLQNQNNKIRDNSVLLDWRTTYPAYKSSAIFSLADRLLGVGQDHELSPGEAWAYYFPYKVRHLWRSDDSFTSFLRFSLGRPRDIISMMMTLQENFVEKEGPSTEVFRQDDFDHVDFRRKYADYMLGEIKDYLSFYYSPSDYELFLKFFEYLMGSPRFTYDEYLSAYKKFMAFVDSNLMKCPAFFESADTFLQFLYELSIICYVEQTDVEPFPRWCYRERSYANISPKVKVGLRYEIHYGLGKALNVGRRFRR